MLSAAERRRSDRGRPCRWHGCKLQGPETGDIIPVWVGFDVEDDVRTGAGVAEGQKEACAGASGDHECGGAA